MPRRLLNILQLRPIFQRRDNKVRGGGHLEVDVCGFRVRPVFLQVFIDLFDPLVFLSGLWPTITIPRNPCFKAAC
jgi:hypothetical protein